MMIFNLHQHHFVIRQVVKNDGFANTQPKLIYLEGSLTHIWTTQIPTVDYGNDNHDHDD